ncbi:hypothetical protein [Romboutsia lituseburensis]|nr:hypothetical protein [Romboutsia lituseburensis]MCR8744377.1 hypothetical protein [Romboutsia lituseburensis]
MPKEVESKPIKIPLTVAISPEYTLFIKFNSNLIEFEVINIYPNNVIQK